jgi:hypothetical protein
MFSQFVLHLRCCRVRHHCNQIGNRHHHNVVECDIVVIKFVIAIIIDWRQGSLGCMLVSRWCETGSVSLSILSRVTIGGSDGCLEASKIDPLASRTWGSWSGVDGTVGGSQGSCHSGGRLLRVDGVITRLYRSKSGL